MAVWLVRAGRDGQDENIALEKHCVIIGFHKIPDMSHVTSKEKMAEEVSKAYPDSSKNTIGNLTSQLWAFKDRIKAGDTVILPLKTRSAIAIGKIQGPYEYKTERHTRPVKWEKTDIPRKAFMQDLLHSFGAFMTVCQIQRNNAEDRIKAALKTGQDPYLSSVETRGFAETDEEAVTEASIDIGQYALDQIREYIGTRFKAHDLTALVDAILKAQGYNTFLSPPGPDGGVDILAGKGQMGFDQPRLVVQVKSGSSPEDVGTLRELQGIMKNFGAQYGLLASWSGFKSSVYKEAKTLHFEVRLWDADQIIKGIFENYNNLPEDIQAELPLKRIWSLVPEEM